MSTSRVTVFMGMDISAFRSGLDKASGRLETFKRTLKTGDIAGGLKQALGAGALIQGFRQILESAQEARDKARELGAAIDPYTAAAAAYADQWDRIKESIAGAAVKGLGFFASIGNRIGQAMGTASSPEEFAAPDAAQRQQAKTDADLAANKLRLGEKLKAALKENEASYQRVLQSEMTSEQKYQDLLKRRTAEIEKIKKLSPGSIAHTETATGINNLTLQINELEKAAIKDNQASFEKAMESKMTATEKYLALVKTIGTETAKLNALPAKSIERYAISTRINTLNAELPAARKASIEENTFTKPGPTLAEIASAAPVGRRSERERLAAQSMALTERSRRAEAAGNYGFAADLQNQARSLESAVSPGGGKMVDMKWLPGEKLLGEINKNLAATTVSN